MEATQTGADVPQNPRDAILARIAQSRHEEAAPDMAEFDEETGVIKAKEEPKQEAKQDETETKETPPRDESGRFVAQEQAEEKAPEAEPSEPRKFKVKVYGQESEVDEDELVRGYQISVAARRQLEAANAAKRQYEEALARIGQTTKLPEGAEPNQLQAEAKPAIPPLEAISAIVRHEVEQNEAVAQFRRDFPDIAGDPVLYREAIAREDQRLWAVKNGVQPDEPLADALRKHGEAIRQWKAKLATPVSGAHKVAAKAGIVNIPAASMRAPAPAQEKPKTLQDTIAEMRAKRGFRTG